MQCNAAKCHPRCMGACNQEKDTGKGRHELHGCNVGNGLHGLAQALRHNSQLSVVITIASKVILIVVDQGDLIYKCGKAHTISSAKMTLCRVRHALTSLCSCKFIVRVLAACQGCQSL